MQNNLDNRADVEPVGRKRVVICTLKKWNISKAEVFAQRNASHFDVRIISEKKNLNYETIKEIDPIYMFFPHWSYIIPADIYENYECVVFHMTDLPFGRGGSPLQNLIVRGIKDTMISAIRVVKEIDAGPVYSKKPLPLYGTAEEIYMRAADTIFSQMIPEILQGDLKPVPQRGEAVVFSRRRPEESEVLPDLEMDQIYDRIRMLDADGYPAAFIKFGNYRISLSRASISADGVKCDALIEPI